MPTKRAQRLSLAQVAAFRMRRHHLLGSLDDLVSVSRDVGGVQAQVMSAAETALWARVHPLERRQIHAALWDVRTLVKTSCQRMTLHLIPAADFPLYVGALGRCRLATEVARMGRWGIKPREIEDLNRAVAEALASGPLPHAELKRRLRPAAGKKLQWWMDRVANVARTAFAEGLLCYGPGTGGEVAFVRADRWLPRQHPIPEPEAQQILFRRYLAAYGPATVQDFAHWSGIPMAAVRAAGSLEDELEEVEADGVPALVRRQDVAELAGGPRRAGVVRLLGGFDPYLLAHATKDHLVPDRFYKRVYRAQGWISPVVLLDGRVVAVWSLTRGKRSVFEVEPFEDLPRKARGQIEQQAESLARFLETPSEVKFKARNGA